MAPSTSSLVPLARGALQASSRSFSSSAARRVLVESASAPEGVARTDNNLTLEQRLLQRGIVDSLQNLGSTQHRASATTFRPHKTRTPPSKDALLSALLAAGAHLGHAHAAWHPSTKSFVHGIRHGQSIIDLEVTVSALRRAANVVRAVVERDGIVLFVGGKTRTETTRAAIRRAAEALGSNGFAVPEQWLPGTLTNASVLLPRVSASAAPKEGGRPPLPDLVVLTSPLVHPHALRECALTHTPTIGLVDTDADPRIVTYPIPANDESERTAELVLALLGEAGKQGREERMRKRERAEKIDRARRARVEDRRRARGQESETEEGM